MAANLVSPVSQFLTPDMIGRIATALGLDRNKVQSAAYRHCWRRSITPPLSQAGRRNSTTLVNLSPA